MQTGFVHVVSYTQDINQETVLNNYCFALFKLLKAQYIASYWTCLYAASQDLFDPFNLIKIQ